jgi:hypothetical protein
MHLLRRLGRTGTRDGRVHPLAISPSAGLPPSVPRPGAHAHDLVVQHLAAWCCFVSHRPAL